MAACSSYMIVFLFGLFTVCRSQFELDERFLEYRKHGMWLVEFYAPWCGHCKNLEPIFKDVARELQQMDSPVKVAKMDCTRYSHIASEFSVKGFPTIMFIQGDRMYTHKEDRTKENILEFVLRAQGPAVRKLASVGKFNEALSQHSDSVFFLYIGNDDEHEDLFKKYVSSAETHLIHSYFYYGKKHILEDRTLQRHPTVLVFKDKKYYEYDPPDGIVTALSLESFINRERYTTFPKMSGPGLNEMVGVSKYLVILTVESQELKDAGSETARWSTKQLSLFCRSAGVNKVEEHWFRSRAQQVTDQGKGKYWCFAGCEHGGLADKQHNVSEIEILQPYSAHQWLGKMSNGIAIGPLVPGSETGAISVQTFLASYSPRRMALVVMSFHSLLSRVLAIISDTDEPPCYNSELFFSPGLLLPLFPSSLSAVMIYSIFRLLMI